MDLFGQLLVKHKTMFEIRMENFPPEMMRKCGIFNADLW
jgi:hypothetical protein